MHESSEDAVAWSLYAEYAARRRQWDALIWQVPALSLAVQAFILALALGPDTTALTRCLAAILGFIVALACISLMARHRISEILDAQWLESFEKVFAADFGSARHGLAFKQTRDLELARRGGLFSVAARPNAFVTWVCCLGAFAAVDVLVLLLVLTGHADLLTVT